jgi:hypothetical protein
MAWSSQEGLAACTEELAACTATGFVAPGYESSALVATLTPAAEVVQAATEADADDAAIDADGSAGGPAVEGNHMAEVAAGSDEGHGAGNAPIGIPRSNHDHCCYRSALVVLVHSPTQGPTFGG